MKIPLPYTTDAQKPVRPILFLISKVPGTERVRNFISASNAFCVLVMFSAYISLPTSLFMRLRFPLLSK